MRGYFARHAQTMIASLGKLASAPLASLLTMLVIGVTLALPATLHVAIKNALDVTGGWESAIDFTVYLDPAVASADARRLAGLLEARADINAVTFIDADAALAEFKRNSGFGDALDGLDSNPLPHAITVRPLPTLGESATALLKQELENLPETDLVQLDTEWVGRFQAVLRLMRRAIWLAAGMLGVALLVVIGNTIRLDIQNRRDEIEIIKLIGGSDGFIRRPFLYTGFWYGAAGGLLALLLVIGALALLAGPVSELAGLYGSVYALQGLGWRESLAVVGIAIMLGLGGSWFAAARHMRRIEPR